MRSAVRNRRNLAFSAFLLIVASAASSDDDKLLTVLRARDAQFDNINLHCTLRCNEKVYPAAYFDYQFGGTKKSNRQPPGLLKPKIVEVVRYQQMIVRGLKATFISDLDPKINNTEGLLPVNIKLADTRKWGNTGGMQRAYDGRFALPSQTEETHLLRVNPQDMRLDTAQEMQRECEFAHGYGFGKWIQKVTSLVKTDDGWEVEASIQLWHADTSTIRMLVDGDYIVREALVDARVGDGQNVIRCRTEGTFEANGLLLPARGTYEHRTSPTTSDNADDFPSYGIRTAFDVMPTGLDRNLSDSEYNALTSYDDLPTGTVIFDSISDTRSIIGNPGIVVPLDLQALVEENEQRASTPAEFAQQPADAHAQGATLAEASSVETENKKAEVVGGLLRERWPLVAGVAIACATLTISLAHRYAKRSRGEKGE